MEEPYHGNICAKALHAEISSVPTPRRWLYLHCLPGPRISPSASWVGEWVGVCEFKGPLSHWAFDLSGPVCPELWDTNVSSALERARGSSLGYLHQVILGGERGGRCVWHRSTNWENGKLWLLPTGVNVQPKDRWIKINFDVKVGLHVPFCPSSFHS